MSETGSKLKRYTLGEEIGNSVTHGVGTLLAIAGCVIVVVMAAIHGDPWAVVSAAIYGASLIILYCMSTLYHAFTGPRVKGVFRVLDHSTIFLLIAGTYTPITLVTLRGPLGFTLFGIIWGMCILGIVLNAVSIERFKKFSMICYLVTGWAVIVAIRPMIAHMKPGGLWLLVAGGVCYTVGIVFYKLKHKFMHAVWHLFVLAGSILHYFSILFYVV